MDAIDYPSGDRTHGQANQPTQHHLRDKQAQHAEAKVLCQHALALYEEEGSPDDLTLAAVGVQLSPVAAVHTRRVEAFAAIDAVAACNC